MRVIRTRAELAGLPRPGTRAVVMTMGALHEGHLALVRAARARADEVVVTVFVNPLQFGPGEDLDRYPRDLARDVALLEDAGAHVVFAPDVAEMYPAGPPDVRVAAGPVGEVLEGATRPGHFDGVLTVVLKLLHLTAPHLAFFGQKDAQQLMAVRAMIRDLDVPVEIVAVPTVRDADGVALSSRNAYLSPQEREAARSLSAALTVGERAAAAGEAVTGIRAAAAAVLDAEPRVAVDYVAVVHPETARDLAADHTGPAVLAVAARVGPTRLIDNVPLDVR